MELEPIFWRCVAKLQLVNNRENKLLFLDGDELYMYEVKSGLWRFEGIFVFFHKNTYDGIWVKMMKWKVVFHLLYTISSLLIILSLVIYILSLQSKIKKLESQQALPFKGDKALEKQIVDMNNNGSSQVEMVKLVRNETGLGLVPAKKYVDQTLNNSLTS